MVEIRVNMKSMFFDQKSVIEAMDRKTHAALLKVGAFLMTRARRKMRPATKNHPNAKKGESPRTHKNPNLKKRLLFAWDRNSRSLVVGPEYFAGPKSAGIVPRLMEEGGSGNVELPTGRIVRAKFDPHPTMGTSLNEEIQAGTIEGAYAGPLETSSSPF